jgi:hypothetical protein
MSDLFNDVWQDLRERRLWPIALVLVLAIVAIPVALTKSAAQPPASAPLADTGDAYDRVTVKLDGADAASTGAGSALDEFAEGDPFTPPSAIAKSAGAGAAASASLAGPSDDGGSGTPSGDGGGSSPSPSPDPVDIAPPVTRTETSQYEYVADVTFWAGDRRREIRGLRKLDMLPNQSAPVLIFMGTAGDGGNAVFLVDSTLKAAGEGRCVPSRANCAYVHVGPGSEEEFTTEQGDSYRLRVDEIRRVKLKASAADRPSARTAVGDDTAVRRFQLPSLADLVAVTSTETAAAATQPDNASSPASGGR